MQNQRIIIIGGLSAGPSAAAKARREDEHAEILLFEKTNYISYATCGIPYAISGKIKDREKLIVVKPTLLENRFKVQMHLDEPVTGVDVNAKEVYTEKGVYEYDKLIYAAGATAFTPAVQGLDVFRAWSHAKSLEDFDRIVQASEFQNAETVAVVGAGLIGLETAENLIDMGKKVVVIERGPHILGPWDDKFTIMGEKILRENGIDLKLNAELIRIGEDGSLYFKDGSQTKADYLIMSIGVVPNTRMLADQGAETLGNGALIVNDKMETNLPDVYAAGDCAAIPDQLLEEPGWFPMGTHSNKAGRVAGANAVGAEEHFKGGYGTAIMKMFDYTIARTGLGPKKLNRIGKDFKSSFSMAGATPGFYPDQSFITTEIYYDPETKIILGAEAIGKRGVDKRIDVLSTAIYAKLTIEDLPQLDLAYAPPFSPAKDPVIVSGFVGENSEKGIYTEVKVDELDELINQVPDLQIIDVRNPDELRKLGHIPGAINIPLDQIRDRLDEIDKAHPILLYCAKGLRGYLSTLILHHNGFKELNNLAGGYTAYLNMYED